MSFQPPSIEALTLREIATPYVKGITPEASLHEAADRMDRNRISALLVASAGRGPVGVITKSDLVRAQRGVSHCDGKSLARNLTGTVRDVMSPIVVTMSADQAVTEAARAMAEERIHRVFVMDGAELFGIVSLLDIARAVGRLAPRGPEDTVRPPKGRPL